MFLWDEVERLIDLEQNDSGFLERLRDQIHDIDKFRFVIASTQTLSALFDVRGKCSHFLSTFRWIPLSGLDDNDALALLRCDQINGWRNPISDDVLNKAVQWSDGHPLILHELGSKLEDSVGDDGGEVNERLLRDCCDQLSRNPALVGIIKDDYSRLTSVQQNILTQVYQSEVSLSLNKIVNLTGYAQTDVKNAVGFLADYGYVFWKDNHVCLRFSFYPQFLSTGIHIPSLANQNKVNRIKHTVFISYSRKDNDYFEEIRTLLEPLARNSEIDIWHDQKIDIGNKWREEIEQALSQARVALLLISQSFLDSKFTTQVELPKLLAKSEGDECCIMCLHVRPSNVTNKYWDIDGKKVSLTDFQGLNPPDQPLSQLSRDEREKVFSNIAQAIFPEEKIEEDEESNNRSVKKNMVEDRGKSNDSATNDVKKLIWGVGVPFIALTAIFAEVAWAVSKIGKFATGGVCIATFVLFSAIIFFAGRFVNIIQETTYYKLTVKLFKLVKIIPTSKDEEDE